MFGAGYFGQSYYGGIVTSSLFILGNVQVVIVLLESLAVQADLENGIVNVEVT